jgi:hypothetical protein
VFRDFILESLDAIWVRIRVLTSRDFAVHLLE